jgi:SAM-dependent methyltransferase
MIQPWYEEWFDSPYYHILYGNRDQREAEEFLSNLLKHLQPDGDASMLDLACGKGRHSMFLASHNFQVTGIDLSDENILHARQFESDHLQFYKHDMRNLLHFNYFDYIFNFFTSFGYFDSYKDHLDTIKNVCRGLKKNGTFVIDFLNSQRVLDKLKSHEIKQIGDVNFNISRQSVGKRILKTIKITDGEKEYAFEEKVWAIDLNDFQSMFEKACLQIVEVYGDYQLNKYNAELSDRLIIIAKKLN